MSDVSPEEWRARIAQAASRSARGDKGETPTVGLDQVEAILLKHRIEATPLLPRKRHLLLRSTHLKGEKPDGRPMDFSWDLGPGLYALLSDGNSKGKSSVLNLIRGALQGRFPDTRLKADIWAWLKEFSLVFSIDETRYRVRISKPVGPTSPEQVSAALTRLQERSQKEIPVFAGAGDDVFSERMQDFFMDELGFSSFHAFRKDHGGIAEHGWNVFSAALFIMGPGPALFGDVASDGLPLRLLQLFSGLPWVTTFSAASTALKKVEAELKAQKATSAPATPRLNELETEIADLERRKRAFPDFESERVRHAGLHQEFRRLQAKGAEAVQILHGLGAQTSQAHSVRQEAERRLLHAREDAAAGVMFRRLQPGCCPACAQQLEQKRYAGAAGAACGLCGQTEQAAAGTDSSRIASMERNLKDAERVYASTRKKLAEAAKQKEALESDIARTQGEIAQSDALLGAAGEAEALERRLIGAQARLAERRQMIPQQTSSSEDLLLEKAVLKAAEEVTKGLFTDLQGEILSDVSGKLLAHCQEFGVQNLEALDIQSGGRINLRQGGQDLTFSGLNPGERLRTQIAAALAVLDVAESRGHGRHPGLIVLDSPAASEMSPHDFTNLIGSVARTVERYERIQILVGALNRDEIQRHIPVDRQRRAEGDEPLF